MKFLAIIEVECESELGIGEVGDVLEVALLEANTAGVVVTKTKTQIEETEYKEVKLI